MGRDTTETPKASRPRRNRGAIGAEGSGSGRDVPLASGGGSVECAQPLHRKFFEFILVCGINAFYALLAE